MPVLSQVTFDLVDKIKVAGAVRDVWDVYLGATRQIGLPYAFAGILPSFGMDRIQVIANALPKGCLEGYVSNELAAGDMVLERVRNTNSSFEWHMSDWTPAHMTTAQRRWREHCQGFGLQAGFCVIEYLPSEEMLLTTCGGDFKLEDHDKLALSFIGREALHRLQELTASQSQQAGLSQRERECLQWAAAGKTDWEIGQILSLSEKTVNVYIDRAKSKFGVKTRTQAIVLATKNGLISNSSTH